jgi:hypothetical protein
VARRQVRQTGKGPNREITSLCNRGEWWSPRSKADAISDIRNNISTYYVSWPNGPTTEVKVVNGPTGPYLRTDRDNTERNNLLDLPDC